MLAASHERATQRELADRFGISTHRVRSILKHHDLSGGPLVRQLRAQPARLRELELTARQREVIDLVVARRVTPADAAERLSVSPATIAADLKALSIHVQDADGTENAADTT